MSMGDQGLLSLRPCQGTRDRSTRRPDEKLGRLTCQLPSPAASPMDVDDLLSEVLLRLAPLPSSLPRASLVCTRWRRLVTGPGFLRRFRAHHWKPLGVFFRRDQDLCFSFFFDPRDSAPPKRFSVRVPRVCHHGGGGGGCTFCVWEFLDCRHGRVILANYGTRQILVWNPFTGEDHLLGVSQFDDADDIQYRVRMEAVLIPASGNNGPFKLALAWNDWRSSNAHICVYSLETRIWGNVASASIEPLSSVGRGNVMVGNTLYWILFGSRRLIILEFDLGSQNLSVIEVPPDVIDYENHCGIFLCTLAKGGGLGFMVMSENLRAQLWLWEKMNEDSDGIFQWVLGGTIELDMLLSLRSEGRRSVLWLDGDDNVMFVSTYKGTFMVHLQSMQFEKIFEAGPVSHWPIFAFKYLHAPGDILHQGGVGSSRVQGSGQEHGEDRADRWVLHASTNEGGAQAYIAGLKRDDAHVCWDGSGPT